MRFFRGVLLLSLVAASARAAVFFDPPRPTDRTFVTMNVHARWPASWGCQPFGPVVTRNGNAFLLRFMSWYCDCVMQNPIRESIPLGLLPAGTYQVQVTTTDGLWETTTFEVAEADPEVLVSPSQLDSNRYTAVTIRTRNDGLCNDPVNSVVTVDGSPVSGTRTTCAVQALMPPHPPGPVEVVVQTDAHKYRSVAAVHYFDPAGAPDPRFYERVLVPLLVDEAGAMGSHWVTESTMTNTSEADLLWRHQVARPRKSAVDALPALRRTSLSIFGDRPAGLVLFVPRELSPSVYFGSLVRDRTRKAEWGTEIPIVRESDAYTGPMRMVNVPFDPRYRLQLRVYGIDGASVPFKVRAITDGLTVENELTLAAPCTTETLPCNSDAPAYASVDLHVMFPWLTDPQIIRIDPLGVTTPLRYWAMVSVTDNETQAVTLITPQ